ncbi:MAG: tRNA (N6-isopentenyl adenosine(37)-C2)-methylthiotransferase MiaB [Pseudomonadota bacterium]
MNKDVDDTPAVSGVPDPGTRRRLYVKTHGCQMNEYDSARMADVLAESHGYVRVDSPEEADLLLLNTCSIREKAQEKVFHQLGRWKALKRANPQLRIGVGGCVASQEGDALRQRAPQVDLVFGPQTLHRLPAMIDAQDARAQQPQAERLSVVDVTFPEIEKFDHLPEPRADGASAFVSVMEGCSKYCSFCVVPYTRGEEVSRPVDSVIDEVRSLAGQGVREVNLLGQNVNAYRGAIDDDTADLAELIYYVADVPGVDRIRFTTSHPMEFGESLVRAYAEVRELATHLHLPVQSGSDAVLARMKRGHTADDYRRLIDRIRVARPGIALSSDFIVGFPGETEADFRATLELVKDINFDLSFSFVYSARPGTPAAALEDPVPEAEKKAWLAELQAQLRRQSDVYAEAMVGTVQRVLVTGPAKKDDACFAARTENNRVVNVPLPADASSRPDGFVDVRITEALPNSLRGVLCV